MSADEKPRRARTREATGTIREYRETDREVVREICRRTAYRNRGSAALFEDDELFADYWTKYYTDHEPESCLVVEEDGVVIGYLIGCVDTLRMIRVMGRSIVPGIIAKMLWRAATGRYRNPATLRTMRWMFFHSWREAPSIPLRKYPAHYHCNILRRGHGKNYYTSMVLRFLDYLDSRGVERLHGQIEEPASSGVWRQMVDNYMVASNQVGLLELYAEKPSHFQRVILGEQKPILNKAWGATVSDYRGWIVWTAKKYHM